LTAFGLDFLSPLYKLEPDWPWVTHASIDPVWFTVGYRYSRFHFWGNPSVGWERWIANFNVVGPTVSSAVHLYEWIYFSRVAPEGGRVTEDFIWIS
jgi:hypothetical protein